MLNYRSVDARRINYENENHYQRLAETDEILKKEEFMHDTPYYQDLLKTFGHSARNHNYDTAVNKEIIKNRIGIEEELNHAA